jgi:hypothetical protein
MEARQFAIAKTRGASFDNIKLEMGVDVTRIKR